ncbi:MAG: hypothetical protein RBR09_11195 [Desulfobulbaceae bacterium]|jgi:hypothetical protein|nr:hypothetical protein [Desulfobulbaceae bacterium]
MAEIKSTMDLVMERAARIGKASREELRREEMKKKGVLLAVDFLEGRLDNVRAAIDAHSREDQAELRQGAAESIFRNIFLPRDEIQRQRVDKALQGVVDLSGGAGDVASICRELQTVIDGYGRQREQIRGQLEEQIRMQYEQLLARQTGGRSEGIKIDPTLQPKFQEEWSRIEGELGRQYSAALDQLKMEFKQRLGL